MLAGACLITVMLVWLYYPVLPKSALGWGLLFAIGIPTWLLLEWLGGVVLGAKVFSRLSSFGRIALAVPALLVLIVFAAAVIWLGQWVIAAT